MPAMRPPIRRDIRQRGVALITALLLATLAATVVASLFWQQQVQIRSMENQRLQLQKQWVLRGAIDWARLILRESARHSSIVRRSDAWATPLAETRLDQYVENGVSAGEAAAAVLSGYMVDAQSRYNLGNLARDGAVDAEQLAAFTRLLKILHLDSGAAPAIAQAVAIASRGASALPWRDVDDLYSVPGVTPEFVAGLEDFVAVLPPGTPVNVNTVSVEVLQALLDQMPRQQVAALADWRTDHYFSSIQDFRQKLGTLRPDQKITGTLSVGTDYFYVKGRIRMGRAALESWSLVQRIGQGDGIDAVVVWSRDL